MSKHNEHDNSHGCSDSEEKKILKATMRAEIIELYYKNEENDLISRELKKILDSDLDKILLDALNFSKLRFKLLSIKKPE